MKIMYVSHTKEQELTDGQMGWKNTPAMVCERGHEFTFILRDGWKYIIGKYQELEPDVVVVFGLIGVYVCVLKKLGIIKCPIVNEWNEDFSEMLGKKYWYLPLGLMERFMIRNSDLVTTGSPTRANKARKLGKRVWYSPYAADKHDVEPYPLPGNRLKLVYIGEQSEKKRVRDIVVAVKGLECDLFLTDRPNPELQKIASDNVHFLGRLPNQEDVFRVIKAADICVSTEDNDAPNKLFEYWQMKKQVLAPEGKMSSYQFGVLASNDYRKTLNILIKNKQILNDLVIPAVPTWGEWVDEWLKQVKALVADGSS